MPDDPQARAMRALQEHVRALQTKIEELTCEVEALRQMFGPERAAEFAKRVGAIWKNADAAGAQAEKNERLRQIASDAKGRKH